MNFIGIIVSIFLTWNISGLIILINWSGRSSLSLSHILIPIKLYKHYKINYFGCFWVTLFVNLLCPLFTIGFWFYKLCTIGRKN